MSHFPNYKKRDFRGSKFKNLEELGFNNKKAIISILSFILLSITAGYLLKSILLAITLSLALPIFPIWKLFEEMVKNNQLLIGADFHQVLISWFESDEDISAVEYIDRHYQDQELHEDTQGDLIAINN